ncbi:hypothetical protein [Actinomadura sp. 9N407]|uniref:hypothetical protein n=1 Tax=Actinomadura sp. 9N407 TaxID=3375154 RepID=UPI0037B49FB7
MRSSIPKARTNGHKHVKTTSLRALAVAARLERDHALEGPPGHGLGRADGGPSRGTPDPA